MTRARLILVSLLGLVLLYVFLMASDWLPVSPASAKAARARMEQPAPIGNKNAFAEFWFARHPVPADQMDSLLAEVLSAPPSPDGIGTPSPNSPDTPWQVRWPQSPHMDTEIVCAQGEPECIAKARVRRPMFAVELRRQASVIAAAERLLMADHVRVPEPGPEVFIDYLHQWPGGRELLNDIALKFAIGDAAQEERLCRHVAHWRNLRRNSSNLRISELAMPLIADAAALEAEMRAELPADAPWPEACIDAFAPVADSERELCSVAAAEWRALRYMIEVAMPTAKDTERDGIGGVGQSLINFGVRRRQTLDLFAERLVANDCAGATPSDDACRVIDHVFNPMGCNLAMALPMRQATIVPALADLDRRFRLMAIARDWHKHPDEETRAKAIQQVLGAANPPPDELVYNDDRREIGIGLLDPNAPGPWMIFLPGTYYMAPDTDP